ncbi:MAG: helix-hairpin-helix domain-containing protein [Lachnospiraceae bacterium]|nr:helix-hairpin-helix domain-containing protein [Lachnospiraceae bacterium]
MERKIEKVNKFTKVLKHFNREPQNRRLFWLVAMSILLLTGCGKKETYLLSDQQTTEEAGTESVTDNIAGVEEQASGEQDITEGQEFKTTQETAGTVPQMEQCYVHICGAVKQPGVYAAAKNARVYEVIVMAGGFREDACTDYLNQAACVTDGAQIRVPTQEEVESQGMMNQDAVSTGDSMAMGQTPAQDGADMLVNINTAAESQLCTLPGIGTQKAASIIAYREQQGGFKSKEDLLKVDGIKTATFQKLKDMIKI